MITQSMIIEIRAKTGAGIMNCRDTLMETNGDMAKAIAILKEKGMAIAAKKVERVTTEGFVSGYISGDHKAGALVELNCETDFVAINEEFIRFADDLARQALTTTAQTVPDFVAEKYIADENITIQEALTSLVAKLRENITLRRFVSFRTKGGYVLNYLHGGRIGVLLEIASTKDNSELSSIGKEIAMQIAAINPLFIAKEDINPELLVNESEMYKTQAINDGKPEVIAVKIAAGKIAKYIKEKCLLEQVWIKNGEMTIDDYIQDESRKLGADIKIVRFIRFEKGEGLAKREDNLAQAVREQIYGN